jgi:membrane associated rhomboid family serine protease
VAGGLVHVWLAPPGMRPMALVGASGAVSGLMGAHAVLRPERKIHLGLAVLWAALNLAGMFAIDRAGEHRVSYAAHLGGLAAGLVLGFALGQLFKRRS